MQPVTMVNQFGQPCDAQGNPLPQQQGGMVMMSPVNAMGSPQAGQVVVAGGAPAPGQFVNQFGQPCDQFGNPLSPAAPQQVVVQMPASPQMQVVAHSPMAHTTPVVPSAPSPAPVHTPPPTQNPPPSSPQTTTTDPAAAPVKRDFSLIEKVKLFGALAAALVGMILGIAGYAAWSEKTSDFNGVIANWQATPIVDVQFVVGSCPSGWTAEPLAHISYTHTTTTTSGSGDSQTTTTTTSTTTADLNNWRYAGQSLCTLRSGSDALDRIRFDSNTACPSGYKACGAADCVDTSQSCPMNSWATISSSIASSSSSTDGNGVITKNIPMESDPSATHANALQAISNANGGMAIVEMQVRQGRPCIGQNVGSSADSGKVCSDSIAIPSSGLPSGATKDTANEDPRYSPLDLPSGIDESTFFGWNSGAPSEITRYGMPWYLSYRTEIQWSSSCPQTRQSVVDIKSRVNGISKAQLVLLIFSIFCGLFGLYAFAAVYNEWKKGDSIAADKKQAMVDKCGMVTDTILIIPNLVAIALAAQSKSFFNSMQNSHCSDDTTSATFNFLAGEISKIVAINAVKFAFLTLFLFYKLFNWWRAPKGMTAAPK